MTITTEEVRIRVPGAGDAARLHRMVLKSTGDRTSIKLNDLISDLFVLPRFKHKPEASDECLEFDFDLLVSNTPVVRAYLAESVATGELVGYILYEHYYTPWIGHIMFIADVFVESTYRRRGIARKLIEQLYEVCREENLSLLSFSDHRLDDQIKESVYQRHEFVTLRGPETDWSVLRIDFES